MTGNTHRSTGEPLIEHILCLDRSLCWKWLIEVTHGWSLDERDDDSDDDAIDDDDDDDMVQRWGGDELWGEDELAVNGGWWCDYMS